MPLFARHVKETDTRTHLIHVFNAEFDVFQKQTCIFAFRSPMESVFTQTYLLMEQNKYRCHWCNLSNPQYVAYHDTEWGVPVHDDRKLFEMLILEGFPGGSFVGVYSQIEEAWHEVRRNDHRIFVPASYRHHQLTRDGMLAA